MKKEVVLLVFGLLLIVYVVGGVSAILVDFEQFKGMDIGAGPQIPNSSKLYNQLQPTLGVLFTSGKPYVAVANLSIRPGGATSGDNAIGGSTPNNAWTTDPAYPIVISFFQPENISIPACTDSVSVRADMLGEGLPITLNAFGLYGNLVDSFTINDIGGPTLQVSAPEIHSVQFIGTPAATGGVALDDLTFNTVHPCTQMQGPQGIPGSNASVDLTSLQNHEVRLSELESNMSLLQSWKQTISDTITNIIAILTGYDTRITKLENSTSNGTTIINNTTIISNNFTNPYLQYLSSSDKKNMLCGYAEDNNLTSINDLGLNCTLTYRTSRNNITTATCKCKGK